MIIAEVESKIGVKAATTIKNGEFEIKRGYCCDLMSEVIGKAESDSIWVTVHTNMNVLAVASMIEIKAVIIAEGHEAGEEFLKKAEDEEIAVFYAKENSYIVSGKLYEAGIR